MRNLLLITLLLIVATSCLESDGFHTKRTDVVNITEFYVQDSMVLGDTIQVTATAQENNGCWRDFFFEYNVENDSVLSLAAFGTFESYGNCPSEVVSKDTVIDFKPDSIGIYYFYVARNAYEYTIDTLVVE
jgi:hypothetical protein